MSEKCVGGRGRIRRREGEGDKCVEINSRSCTVWELELPLKKG